jgi:hypothetical protein
MQPVREWLGSLGLSEYADSFDQNRIDLSVLPDLTDQDLKELGLVLGDRRRVLRAIAELFGTASTAPCPAATPELKLRNEAERRQVTVMFVDFLRGPLPQSLGYCWYAGGYPAGLLSFWLISKGAERRGWDSNPRYGYPYNSRAASSTPVQSGKRCPLRAQFPT